MTLISAILATLTELSDIGMTTELRDTYFDTREGWMEFAQSVADKLDSVADEQEAA